MKLSVERRIGSVKWSIGGYGLLLGLCADMYDWVGTLNEVVEGKRLLGFHVGWYNAHVEFPTTAK